MIYINEPVLTSAWVYIAIDVTNLNRCKVGITTRENPMLRIRDGYTSNPFYILFNCYELSKLKICHKELRMFERYLHRKLSGSRISIIGTGNQSEWLRISPFQAEAEVDYYVCNNFDFNGQRSFDENGNIKKEILGMVKHEIRPEPFYLTVNSNIFYEDCKEYIDFLMDYHKYPKEPLPSF
ncbi:GIY-YIG nuclease family protein [Vibrio sp. J2-3(2022)]|uniref:GIY-YIG nuclease family protein n=1 Tax=Vibrio sp. J2-3(2022) TaxID=2912261 RepID=UPI001F41A1E1|nr:GIY-YIG nuclease family protein [Vibrio sp. J2-3(2022)]MCF7373775.1 GIY-YIG nuclease family protein [Vibrio sp. J2-3(2022)]HCH6293777.1 GIY-YIG nuclease family protein [Vibrio parahaemolyticus]